MNQHRRRLHTNISALVVLTTSMSLVCPSHAQQSAASLLLKVDQSSSGPYAGERAALCLRIYSNGKIIDSEWSRAAVEATDEKGKKTRPEETVSFEYQLPEDDLWQIQELEDFLKSKSVAHLPAAFGPPHPPVDFIENSIVQIVLPNGKSKTINVREYYAASLVERAKYPSALVILMDKLARIEDEVTQKETPTDRPASCQLGQK